MMTSLATVIDVESGKITVTCQQQTSCGQCANRDSCGTGLVSKVVPGRAHQIDIYTDQAVSIGDQVEIGLPEATLLSSALLVYIVPLVALIVGAILGQALLSPWQQGELGAIVLALLLSGVALRWVRIKARQVEGGSEYQPSLLRVFGQPMSANIGINDAQQDSE